MDELNANLGKALEITVGNQKFLRIPVKTHLIMKEDNILDVARKYLKDKVKEGDVAFITEKIVAITQGRAIPLEDIKPSFFAKLLSKYVTKTPAGIGLGMPETMEMAIRECGLSRILAATTIGGFSKIALKRRGDFYRIAGYKARSIDGPTDGTIPPYNRYVVLGPENADKVAKQVSEILGTKVIIIDINDLGGNILGFSHPNMSEELYVKILKDNPLGQATQQTPLGIIREIKNELNIQRSMAFSH